MLVLSRKKDEEIIIAEEIRVTLVEVRSYICRIGIVAPGLTIHRLEVYDLVGGGTFEDQEAGGGMLVLSRKPEQSIMIGENIKITVVGLRGGIARIGIEAPRDIVVHRREVHEAIQRERRTFERWSSDQQI